MGAHVSDDLWTAVVCRQPLPPSELFPRHWLAEEMDLLAMAWFEGCGSREGEEGMLRLFSIFFIKPVAPEGYLTLMPML